MKPQHALFGYKAQANTVMLWQSLYKRLVPL